MLNRAEFGAELMRRLDAIAACSAPGPGVTRLPFTPEHRAANEMIADWMARAGLSVRLDAAGTLIGRREGPPGAKTLLVGSHQDSIREGGRFDGILGVALPILALEHLKDAELPFAVEVVAFADEEGVRFPTALMGPRALAGTFDSAALDLRDADGVTLGDALRGFGGDPAAIGGLARDRGDILGYLEAHIEQGPVLESRDLAVGVVTGICGIERWAVEIRGASAHAGTTPMDLRRDALAGAAEAVLEVERRARETEGLLGVVGALTVSPGVVNAVPGGVSMTVELRSLDDATRAEAGGRIAEAIGAIAERRGLTAAASRTYAQPAVRCDERLSDRLAAAVAATGAEPLRLLSGATHDASAMADLCPIAMLFVRCEGGLSHHPDEAVTEADLGAAGAVFAEFLAGG